MIRLLLLALLGYLCFTLLRSLLRLIGGPSRPAPKAPPPSGEEMVQDPECGTFLPRGDALRHSRAGRTEYFCSKACRDAYLAKSRGA